MTPMSNKASTYSRWRSQSFSVFHFMMALCLGAMPTFAHAAGERGHEGGLVTMANWYYSIARAVLGSDERAAHYWTVFSAVGGLIIVTVVGILGGLHKLNPEKMTDEELLPPQKFGFRAFLELCWAVVSSTLENVLGHDWQRYAPLLGGTFLFIILSNISGLAPGFAPSTEHMNQTLAIAIVIFFAFNYYGLKASGLGYLKHMGGPLLLLSPLIFVIEMISLFARPVSLSLRLFGNISGDHLVFQVFSTLVDNAHVPWLPVPAALLGFGTLVACLQAFIFMTLSAVYVRLSVDTAAHGDH